MNTNDQSPGTFSLDDALTAPASGSGAPLNFRNNAIMLEGLATQTDPWHWVREFTQNGLEAPGVSRITWDVDWNHVEKLVAAGKPPVYRATVWNDGIGMTPEELKGYLGSLTVTSKILGVTDNHGLGARASAAWYNQCGIIWMSWVDGVGSMVWLRRLENGNFALHQWEYDDGYDVVMATPDEYNVDAEGNERINGTLVIFMGNHEDQHTWLGLAPGEKYHTKSYHAAVNKRYYTLPEDVVVEAWEGPGKQRGMNDVDPIRDGWPTARPPRSGKDSPDGMKKGSRHRGMKGTLYYYQDYENQKYLLDTGTVDLPATSDYPAARIRYFVFTDTRNNSGHLQCWNMNSYAHTPSYVLAVWDNEVYNANNSTGRLRQFGITTRTAGDRVALVIELDKTTQVSPDFSRSRIVLTNKAKLPWAAWGAAFKRMMPDSIQKLMLELEPKDIDMNQVEDDIRSALETLYQNAKVKPNCGPGNGPNGVGTVGNTPGPGNGGNGGTVPPGPGPRRPGRRPGGRRNPNDSTQNGSGPARIAPPSVKFNRVDKDPTRPASYDRYDGELQVNLNHVLFQRIHAKMAEKYGDEPAWTPQYVTTQLSYHTGVHLGYLLMEAHEMEASHFKKSWDSEDIKRMFCDEALAIACMGQEIGNKVEADCKRKFGANPVTAAVTAVAAAFAK